MKKPFLLYECLIFARMLGVMWKNRGKHLSLGYFVNAVNCEFGKFVKIYDNACLFNCQIDNYTYIGRDSFFRNTKVGKFCSISQNIKSGLGKHPSSDFVSSHPAFYSTLKQCGASFVDKNYFAELGKVIIGNDVWIGANCFIADDVTIGDGAILATGSVVNKDVPPYMIVGGVPAKIIRPRFDEKIIEQLLAFQWWNQSDEWLQKNVFAFHNVENFLELIKTK